MKRLFWMLVMMIGFCYAGMVQVAAQGMDRSNSPNYTKTEVPKRVPVPYPALREADVIYAKRVERIIDTREKKNQVMQWPKNPLNKIIYNWTNTGEAAETGKLKAYKTDSLTNAMTVGDVAKIGGEKGTYTIHDPKAPADDIYATIDIDTVTPFDFSMIKRWQISEEWIFDKQRGMFFPRIIALAPMYQPSLNGVLFPEQPMFYVSWADLRPLLANEEIFNRGNEVKLSYYDFFEQRLFSSYITKESNDKDLAIKDLPEYKNSSLDALYESERIKNDMANWEQDLWEQ